MRACLHESGLLAGGISKETNWKKKHHKYVYIYDDMLYALCILLGNMCLPVSHCCFVRLFHTILSKAISVI